MANKHDVQLRTQLLEKLFPTVETVDNLNSDNPNRPLSARQGKVLKELIKSGGGGSGLSIEVVETLPNPGNAGILYLVPKSSYLKEENKYDEYVWIENTSKYELLGSFSTDLDINEIKSVLGDILQINVATLPDNGINNYVDTGTYRVYGERLNSKDGLPILNAANGHTVEGILRVYNSSIAGTGQNTDKVVTQILSMSNRVGCDGHIWIRTGQGSSKSNLTWSTWEKLQGIFEKNTITDIGEIDTFTTNGIYSCMYVGEDSTLDDAVVRRGATLLIIVINGYMASGIGLNPQLTQSIILSQEGSDYILTRHAIFTDNVWEFNGRNGIMLNSAYITNANIGYQGADARINIGTYEDSKVSINNAFIGNTSVIESIEDPVIIGPNVIIDPDVRITNTYIRTDRIGIGTWSIGSTICHIGNNVNIDNNVNISNYTNIYCEYDDKFYIQSDNNNSYLTLTKDTKINIDASNISLGSGDKNIKLDCNNICLGSANIGKIYIGGNVSISENTNIGENVHIENNVAINNHVSIGSNANIGENTNVGGYTNIGNRVSIGNSTNIGNTTTIGDGVNIKQGVSIGSIRIDDDVKIQDHVNIGKNLNLKNNVTIGNDVAIGDNISLYCSSNGFTISANSLNSNNQVNIIFNSGNTGSIVFEENSIRFSVGNKSATIQLT